MFLEKFRWFREILEEFIKKKTVADKKKEINQIEFKSTPIEPKPSIVVGPGTEEPAVAVPPH